MSIPETALIMRNDTYGTETVAYSDWDELRRDLLTIEGVTPEELDALEAQPEGESQIFRAEKPSHEDEDTGLYRVPAIKGKEGDVYRIRWDRDRKHGKPEFYGFSAISVTGQTYPDDDEAEPEE